jgi:hypothetical protein
MKMKYLWDEWDGVGKLPDNTCYIEFRNGSRYSGDCKMFRSFHEGLDDDIVSYCVAVPDLTGEDYE